MSTSNLPVQLATRHWLGSMCSAGTMLGMQLTETCPGQFAGSPLVGADWVEHGSYVLDPISADQWAAWSAPDELLD